MKSAKKEREWPKGILSRVSREAYNSVRRSRGYDWATPEQREQLAKAYDRLKKGKAV